jgi:DNA recombination protein RmuC
MILPVVFLIAAVVCGVFVIVSMYSKIGVLQEKLIFLKDVESKLKNTEAIYYDLLMEKTKLEERCRKLQEISVQHELLLEKYSLLEKESLLLSTNLEQERKNLQEKIKLLENAEQQLSNTFKVLSSDALARNNSAFIDLAKAMFEQIQEKTKHESSMGTKSIENMVNPIKSALENVDAKLAALEQSRIGAYESLKQQVTDLLMTQNALKTETHHLVSALKTPSVRGHWGEMQLRRVVELAGMLEHCDFREQVFTESLTATGTMLKMRPDMVVYLPNNRRIIIDAKVPLSAYMEAINSSDEKLKKSLLMEHAKQIRSHVTVLASKKYWEQFQPGPEFVVLFLPGEVFFSVATEHDPSLMEFSMRERVIIATPTILLALLHSIALGWRHENLAENAREIIKMGQELYKRLVDTAQHMFDLGRSINNAVQNYNATIASLESRVLVSARKFKNLELHEKNIVDLNYVEGRAKSPQLANARTCAKPKKI